MHCINEIPIIMFYNCTIAVDVSYANVKYCFVADMTKT